MIGASSALLEFLATLASVAAAVVAIVGFLFGYRSARNREDVEGREAALQQEREEALRREPSLAVSGRPPRLDSRTELEMTIRHHGETPIGQLPRDSVSELISTARQVAKDRAEAGKRLDQETLLEELGPRVLMEEEEEE